MVQPLPARLPETPSQTAGPYVHIGLIPHQAGFAIFETAFSNVIAGPDAVGERILVEGRVFDGANEPVRDVLIEVWQADAAGRYAHAADPRHESADPALSGWGRTGSDFETGLYCFETVKPGSVVGRHGRPMAPHLNLWIVARGINIGLQTRLYFADETAANAADPVLNLIEQASRRETLLARRETRDGRIVYVFDIHLQGDAETVFFDV